MPSDLLVLTGTCRFDGRVLNNWFGGNLKDGSHPDMCDMKSSITAEKRRCSAVSCWRSVTACSCICTIPDPIECNELLPVGCIPDNWEPVATPDSVRNTLPTTGVSACTASWSELDVRVRPIGSVFSLNAGC